MSNAPSTGFVSPTPVLPSSTTLRTAACCAARCQNCNNCLNENRPDESRRAEPRATTDPVTRRTALRRGLLAAASVFFGRAATKPASAQAAESDESCRNCYGAGKIPCELCSGTGFWRALSANDPNLKYKGVVCPECEGVGRLTCPVCLGTGEGNIRGLLRRRKVEPGPGRLLQTN